MAAPTCAPRFGNASLTAPIGPAGGASPERFESQRLFTRQRSLSRFLSRQQSSAFPDQITRANAAESRDEEYGTEHHDQNDRGQSIPILAEPTAHERRHAEEGKFEH